MLRRLNTCPCCKAACESGRVRCIRCGAMLVTPSAPPPLVEPRPSAWLLGRALERPLPLVPERVVAIGRERRNDLVLGVLQVSREHASIKWDGAAFVITDRGSTNGTYVNGEAVKRRRLAPGDVIGIGPFELELANDPTPPPRGLNDTQLMLLPGTIAGELTHVSVPELCQMIELNQKTGVLAFKSLEDRGAVYFSQGRAIHAEYRDLIGDAAALDLLSLRYGTFRFLSRESMSLQRTIRRTTASLLLETAKRRDDESRAAIEVAA